MRSFLCSSILALIWGALTFPGLLTAASPPAWMPGEQDDTELYWEQGVMSGLGHPPRTIEPILHFRYGNRHLRLDTRRVRPLDTAWECAVVVDGRRYTCAGLEPVTDSFFQPVRFVESGRCFQRVALEGLRFVDAEGQAWTGHGCLEVSVWPDRLGFQLEVEGDDLLSLRHGSSAATGRGVVRLEIAEATPLAQVTSELPVQFDAVLGCHQLALPEKPWPNPAGTTYPEDQLDRVDRWHVTLSNDSDKPAVARLLFRQQRHLPITGFTPMLCEPDGTPTGLPVQVSKNWHRRPEKGVLRHEGPWFHGFAWVRVPPRAQREFVFQMIHARYGGVCAASHGQLSLIGWGHNQFWDQAAVGSFGENICFEPGRVQRRSFITDIRPLLTRMNEPDAKPWSWAGNAGGGDFLLWKDVADRYQPMKATRTHYHAHGPCLTRVVYAEESPGDEVAARMEVAVPAANDHLRTFFRLRYDVRLPLRWSRLAFFQLGADFYNDVPARRVAIGDAGGLREEWQPVRAKDVYDRRAMPWTGPAAWVSVHGAEPVSGPKGGPAASRGLILRSWKAVLGGRPAAPHLAFYATEWGKGNHRTAVELAPPPGLAELVPGDFVEAELELVVFPIQAEAYYGPDAALRTILAESADTWRPVLREAVGNALEPRATAGTLTRPYPLEIAVDPKQKAQVSFQGGLGHVPVTFTGLKEPRGHELRVNGTVAGPWQTDWEPATQRWRLTYNLAVRPGQRFDLTFGRAP